MARRKLKVTVHRALLRVLGGCAGGGTALVLREWQRSHVHRDVRIAILKSAFALLEAASTSAAAGGDDTAMAWSVLEAAAADESRSLEPAVKAALLSVLPHASPAPTHPLASECAPTRPTPMLACDAELRQLEEQRDAGMSGGGEDAEASGKPTRVALHSAEAGRRFFGDVLLRMLGAEATMRPVFVQAIEEATAEESAAREAREALKNQQAAAAAAGGGGNAESNEQAGERKAMSRASKQADKRLERACAARAKSERRPVPTPRRPSRCPPRRRVAAPSRARRLVTPLWPSPSPRPIRLAAGDHIRALVLAELPRWAAAEPSRSAEVSRRLSAAISDLDDFAADGSQRDQALMKLLASRLAALGDGAAAAAAAITAQLAGLDWLDAEAQPRRRVALARLAQILDAVASGDTPGRRRATQTPLSVECADAARAVGQAVASEMALIKTLHGSWSRISHAASKHKAAARGAKAE